MSEFEAKVECVQQIRDFGYSYRSNPNAHGLSESELRAAESAIIWCSNRINGLARGLREVTMEKT